MGNDLVESQLTLAKDTLTTICDKLAYYLNETTITEMLNEGQESEKEYYQSLLSSIRRVLVFCEEGTEACEVILNGKTFRKVAAEKTLFWI